MLDRDFRERQGAMTLTRLAVKAAMLRNLEDSTRRYRESHAFDVRAI